MAIPFTQFLRPDGRTRFITISRPVEIEAIAAELVVSDCGFEIEELATGEVSMTCECSDPEQTLAIEVVPNGPEVPAAVDRLILNAKQQLERIQA